MRPPQFFQEGEVLLVTLDDPSAVNEGQAHGLRQVLYGEIESRDRPLLAVDLGAIDFLSSTGIALLIGLKRRVEARMGKLVLVALRPDVRDLLELMRLVDLFEIVGDRDQALEFLRSSPPA